MLIHLWRVQSSELRKRRNTCSVQLFRQFGSSRVTAASSGLLSPSEDVWTHQHATAGHGRGLWNSGMFIVDLVSAAGYNRCLVWTNTIILHHAAISTRVLRGFFPFKSANINNHWLAPVGCSQKPTFGRNTNMREGITGVCWASFPFSLGPSWFHICHHAAPTGLRTSLLLSHHEKYVMEGKIALMIISLRI